MDSRTCPALWGPPAYTQCTWHPAHNLVRSGLMARCAEVRAAGVAVLDIDGHGAGDAPVATAIRKAAADYPGAALVLGCAGMAELAHDLSAELGRPVIDGVAAGVSLAAGLVRCGRPPA